MQQQSSIFISYRRTDVEFVKRLDQGFKAQERDVWVDWEDIPPASTDFKDDIIRGIEEADVFVAVLSPDYLESTYCVDLELGYALELNKRVIPVVYRKFDDKPAPNGIGHINWVFFTPHAGQSNTFEEAFPRLMAAIDVDLAHTRTHTRLTVQAKEWENNERENSYLLDGLQIEGAEAWLAQATNKKPFATELLVDFINMSRHVEHEEQAHKLTLQRRSINRLRYLAVVFVIATVLVAGLLVRIVQLNRQVELQRIATNQELVFDNLQGGNYEEALTYANVGIDTYNDLSVYDERGEANLALANYDAALKDFDRAIEAAPNNADLYNLRGQVYAALGDQERAIEQYNRAIELDPTLVDAFNNRGLSHEAQGLWEAAYRDLTEAIRLDDVAEYHVHRGRISMQLENWREALGDFDRAIEHDPEFAAAYFYRGRTHSILDNYSTAIQDFSRAIVLQEGFAEALFERALAFAEIGAVDFAFIDYGLATSLDDSFGEATKIVQLETALGLFSAASVEDYVVQPYDTIYSVAARFNVSVNDLIVENNLPAEPRIVVGQTLAIP